jgi:prepilin peptidase CpaA
MTASRSWRIWRLRAANRMRGLRRAARRKSSSASEQVDIMPEWLPSVVFVVGVLALTGVSAYTDARTRRIPNWLTVPAFVAGLIYQGLFHQWPGLVDAGSAFAVGFGTFFVLWLVGGGGGGDVKLMGALSVWLGLRLTLYALVLSMVFVIVGTGAVLAWTVLRHGVNRMKNQYLATGRTDAQGRSVTVETVPQRKDRRVMAFAVPVALAVWVIMLLDSVAIRNGQLGP